MNIDNFNTLINHMKETSDSSFNMGSWFYRVSDGAGEQTILSRPEVFSKEFKEKNTCGTVGCIAGHAMLLAVRDNDPSIVGNFSARTVGRDYLGLDNELSQAFFSPGQVNDGTVDYRLIKREDAIKALETLRDTGTFDWYATDEYTYKVKSATTEVHTITRIDP